MLFGISLRTDDCGMLENPKFGLLLISDRVFTPLPFCRSTGRWLVVDFRTELGSLVLVFDLVSMDEDEPLPKFLWLDVSLLGVYLCSEVEDEPLPKFLWLDVSLLGVFLCSEDEDELLPEFLWLDVSLLGKYLGSEVEDELLPVLLRLEVSLLGVYLDSEDEDEPLLELWLPWLFRWSELSDLGVSCLVYTCESVVFWRPLPLFGG